MLMKVKPLSANRILANGRASYGEALLKRLAQDLTVRLGRGFSERNLRQMQLFYLGWPKRLTPSAELADAGVRQTPSAGSVLWPQSPLPWSHYVRLLSVADRTAREYHACSFACRPSASRSQWAEPYVYSDTAGQITAAATSRQIQLALKLLL
jgi:hypothetical protein